MPGQYTHFEVHRATKTVLKRTVEMTKLWEIPGFKSTSYFHMRLLKNNFEAPPAQFRDQGDMAIKLLGAREQEENKAESTGAVFLILRTGITKIEKILLGNKRAQGKFCWEQRLPPFTGVFIVSTSPKRTRIHTSRKPSGQLCLVPGQIHISPPLGSKGVRL